jgi:hypothetical protein
MIVLRPAMAVSKNGVASLAYAPGIMFLELT